MDLNKLAQILAYEEIVVDTETTGLNVRKDRVIGIGLSASENISIYIPIWTWNGTELKNCGNDEVVQKVLQTLRTKSIICHNAAFDLRIIKHNLGVDLLPSLYVDTILLKHTCDENPPFALKDIATMLREELGFTNDPKEEKTILEKAIVSAGGKATKSQYDLYKAPTTIIGNYCEQDCKLTHSIYKYYMDHLLDDDQLVDLFNDEVMPLYKTVSIPMMERGIKLDIDKIKQAYSEIKIDLDNLEIETQEKLLPYTEQFKRWFFEKEYPVKTTGNFATIMAKMYNLPLPMLASGKLSVAKAAVEKLPPSQFKTFLQTGGGLSADIIKAVQWEMHTEGEPTPYFINIRSKDHLKRIIFNYLGEKPDRLTEKGAWQLDDDMFQSISDKYAFIPPLLVFNKLSKISATYMERFLDTQEDGTFYPQFNQHRTISGRFGSDIQQLPRPMESGDPLVMKYTNMIRTFFISREGYSFVDDDYESLEPHIFAHVSGDKGLQNIFNNGEDFYSKIAIMTENLKGVSADKRADNYLGKVNKGARQKAKAYCLGIPYGLEDYKLHKELNIPQQEARRLIDQYLNAYPNLKEWMKQTDVLVKATGMVRTEVGRLRRMPRAVEIYQEHGEGIFDSLGLWKRYNESPALYAEVKKLRREMKNYIGNGRNFQIQSLSASVMNRACILIASEFKKRDLDAHLVAQIHDQVVVECYELIIEEVKEIVRNCMENVIKLNIKLKAPPSVGKNFAESH
jgi:DNA polymerase I-like protein with 3'-5' exonuclease and polymerase domains